MFNKKHLFVLAVGAAAVGLLTIAASGPEQGQYKLGGAWIGKGAGAVWNCLMAPKDPAGNTVGLYVKYQAYGADLAGLAAAFGADRSSEAVGEAVMINRDTDKFTLVSYGQAVGANGELEIKSISVVFGTLQFTDANHAVLHYAIKVYPAAADADGDGMPDPGATPAVTIPDLTDTAQRVPILQ